MNLSDADVALPDDVDSVRRTMLFPAGRRRPLTRPENVTALAPARPLTATVPAGMLTVQRWPPERPGGALTHRLPT